tara:strand:- start:249 stop:470 length:222 start_codon:yes stop_codon:yes gene_type:complete
VFTGKTHVARWKDLDGVSLIAGERSLEGSTAERFVDSTAPYKEIPAQTPVSLFHPQPISTPLIRSGQKLKTAH